jgi:hypothetical protein
MNEGGVCGLACLNYVREGVDMGGCVQLLVYHFLSGAKNYIDQGLRIGRHGRAEGYAAIRQRSGEGRRCHQYTCPSPPISPFLYTPLPFVPPAVDGTLLTALMAPKFKEGDVVASVRAHQSHTKTQYKQTDTFAVQREMDIVYPHCCRIWCVYYFLVGWTVLMNCSRVPCRVDCWMVRVHMLEVVPVY